MDYFIIKKGDSKIKGNAMHHIQQLDPDKSWLVEVKQYRNQRSLAQNRLYWKWLTLIGNEYGYTKDELHATFSGDFLDMVEVAAFGETRKVPRSTTDLNTKEFTEYLEKIELTMMNMQFNLPHPDDYHLAMGD